jgi:imidazolonepropionase-like amidohydrolase
MKSYLIENARIFDGSGSPCFPGSVRVEGERIAMVAAGEQPLPREGAEVIDAGGRVLMPGLIDAHTHLAFPSSIERLVPSFGLPPEESLLISARHARILLDHGFTSAYSAGTLAPRLDIVIRDEIKAGRLPGPRLRACAVEQFPASMAALFHADPSTNDSGPDGVRRYVKSAAATGVDVVKFCLSGENQLSPGSSHEVCYSDEEVLAAGEQARESGIWLSAHAQSSKPIQQALKAGFRVIYHCTFADEETLDLMEQSREQIFVAPAVGVLQGTIESGPLPGLPLDRMQSDAKDDIKLLSDLVPRLRSRKIRVLPGGDYGFVWNPTGRNARDLEHFVELFGYTPTDALVAATKLGGEIMGMGDELGLIKENYLADLLIVDGDPLKDIRILQDASRFLLIMQGGNAHKNTISERLRRAA